MVDPVEAEVQWRHAEMISKAPWSMKWRVLETLLREGLGLALTEDGIISEVVSEMGVIPLEPETITFLRARLGTLIH